ncbi:MAG: hypothetical protein KY468_14920 [Armatimonadetes bacterium]|nr:hypothetical protein [Armatimonadota bacterium]
MAELPVLPVKPSGGYKFGKGDFTPLPPLTLVPRNLPLQPFQPAYKPVLPTQKPALPLAPPPSKGVAKVDVPAPQPVGKLEDHRPLIGVNRPVASIVQELANRENLRVIVGPTEGKTLTIQLGDVDPVDALKRVAQMAGLSCRKHEGVWYVATPDWIAKTFPERHYTQVVQLPTEEAGSLATALQKILSNGTQVEAVGGTHLIVRAALTDLETTASVLAQWPKPEGEKMGLVASVTLDLPEGVEETTVQLVKTGAEEVTVEKLTMGRSWIFRGSPNAVLDGVKRYSALVDRTVFSPAAVARRTEP